MALFFEISQLNSTAVFPVCGLPEPPEPCFYTWTGTENDAFLSRVHVRMLTLWAQGSGGRDATHRLECKIGNIYSKILVFVSCFLVAVEGTLADYMRISVSWVAGQKSQKMISDDLKLSWPSWSSFEVPMCVCLCTQDKGNTMLPRNRKHFYCCLENL